MKASDTITISRQNVRRMSALLLLLFLALLLMGFDTITTSTVRGILYWQGGAEPSPASSVRITLLFPETNARSLTTYTVADGSYYFYDVSSGTCLLEIWIDPEEPLRYEIEVLNQEYTDIAPIWVPVPPSENSRRAGGPIKG